MFARFDENPAMTLRVIKETKRYGRTDRRTDGQRENSIPPTNKVCGGIINKITGQVFMLVTYIYQGRSWPKIQSMHLWKRINEFLQMILKSRELL